MACGLVLVALVAAPSLFNPRGQDPFGVIKVGLIETLGTIACVCATLSLWVERRRIPINSLSTATLSVAAAYAIATAVGVAPSLSFYGSSGRHEGTFLTLALIAIAFAISTFDRAQIDAVVTALVIGSIGPVLYELAQTASAAGEPGELMPRVGSTFGNPILLGGYLVVVVPITAAWLWMRRRARWIYGSLLALQVSGLLFARARGAWLGALVGIAVIALAVSDLTSRRRRAVTGVIVACLFLLALGGVVWLRARYGTLIVGRTLQVRAMIWDDVSHLIASRTDRSVFGFGPEMLQSIGAPFHSAGLARLESGFSVADRAHNDLLDTIVAAGVVGAAAVTAVHVVLWSHLCALLRDDRRVWPNLAWILATGVLSGAVALVVAAPLWMIVLAFAAGLVAGLLIRLAWLPPTLADGPAPAFVAIGLLAACVAHFVEIQVGVATVASRLVWWCCIGITLAWQQQHASGRSEPSTAATGIDLLALIGGVSIAALVFSLWQPEAGPTVSSTGLAGVVERATWISHQATAALVFFAMSGVLIGMMTQGGGFESHGQRRFTALMIVVPIAIASSVWIARASRADIIAQLASRLEVEGRWSEAEALEAERVRLDPESDKAWSAWGSAQLERAKRSNEAVQDAAFMHASSTIAEARRRNPFDWFHKRNQASVERAWAAVNRQDRSRHLAAADRYFAEAAAEAPTFARLWAEWGNVDAERGDFPAAWLKLERAASLDDTFGAKTVADAIFRARGIDLQDSASRARVAEELRQQRLPTLASLYRP